MPTSNRSAQQSYLYASRAAVGLDEHDYAGTSRTRLHFDDEQVAGLTRGVVTVDRPRTWAPREN